jgi:hypothetical protein
LTTASLQKDFFIGEENIAINRIPGLSGTRGCILPYLWWGMLHVLLGVYHTLMWDRIWWQDGRGLLHVLLWCLLRGGLCRRRGKAPRVFKPFEISDLGAMVSVMTELTTKSTRVDGFNIIPPLAFVVVAPLGVLVSWVLVAPSRLILLGLIPALTWVVVVPVPSLFGII